MSYVLTEAEAETHALVFVYASRYWGHEIIRLRTERKSRELNATERRRLAAYEKYEDEANVVAAYFGLDHVPTVVDTLAEMARQYVEDASETIAALDGVVLAGAE